MIKSFGKSYERGYEAGFNSGYPIGRQQGISAFYQYFQGASIIVPACNQQEGLRRSLDSIFANIREPHEIIVIDGGSTDGTARYASTISGRVKYRRFETPLGFAETVNQGLRMARGDSIAVLDCGTEAPAGRLPDLISCEQQRPDGDAPEACQPQGFVLLMSRDVFRKLGYMDEGFDNRRDAEEEYRLRARKLGLRLVMAERDLSGGNSAEPCNQPEQLHAAGTKPLNASAFYPTHVIVKGCGDSRYWVEYGVRHLIANGEDLEAVRLSQMDMIQWPKGPAMERNDVLMKIALLSSVPSPYGLIAEGILVRDREGNLYQSSKGELRRLHGDSTQGVWKLENRPTFYISDDILKQHPSGIPVSPPPVIRLDNL